MEGYKNQGTNIIYVIYSFYYLRFYHFFTNFTDFDKKNLLLFTKYLLNTS